MAASTTTAPVAPPSTLVEREDFVIGFEVKKTLKDGKEVTEKKPALVAQEDAEKLEKEGKFEAVSAVTTSVTYPKTLDALLELYKDPETQEELVANHNRGARNKLTNRRNAILLATDDDGNLTYDGKQEKDGVLDLTAEMVSASKRKFLSDEEKVIRSIMSMPIPEAQKQQMLAVYQSKIGG